MANYAIMRMEKRKLPSVGYIGKPHEWLKTEYKSNPDIDPKGGIADRLSAKYVHQTQSRRSSARKSFQEVTTRLFPQR